MKTSRATVWPLVRLACAILLALPQARGEEAPYSSPVPEHICSKLQVLFQRHYPKATYTNLGVNGIHFEYEVATFEFPYTGLPNAKHEATTQRGPKKGGILCSIYLEKGEYRGQRALSSRGNGQFEPVIIDRKTFKQLHMVSYSPKHNVHLSVGLSYPPDASENFLNQFRALIAGFETDTDGPAQQNGATNTAPPHL